MVDSNDRERVNEAREELARMLAEDELRDAVLLVFANKKVSCSAVCFISLEYIILGDNGDPIRTVGVSVILTYFAFFSCSLRVTQFEKNKIQS